MDSAFRGTLCHGHRHEGSAKRLNGFGLREVTSIPQIDIRGLLHLLDRDNICGVEQHGLMYGGGICHHIDVKIMRELDNFQRLLLDSGVLCRTGCPTISTHSLGH